MFGASAARRDIEPRRVSYKSARRRNRLCGCKVAAGPLAPVDNDLEVLPHSVARASFERRSRGYALYLLKRDAPADQAYIQYGHVDWLSGISSEMLFQEVREEEEEGARGGGREEDVRRGRA